MTINPTQIVSLGELVQSPQTIAISTTTSPGFATEGLALVGIQMPAAFTGVSISFIAALTLAGTYQPVYNSSGVVSYTVTEGQFQVINPADFYGVQFLKIVSASSELAARTLVCLLKGM